MYSRVHLSERQIDCYECVERNIRKLAPFIDTDLSKAVHKEGMGLTYEICQKRVNGLSYKQIETATGVHREQIIKCYNDVTC